MTRIGCLAFSGCTDLTALHFQDNAPALEPGAFNSVNGTIYHLPGTTGWDTTFGGLPTALWLPVVQASDASFGVQSHRFGFSIFWASGKVVVVEAVDDLTKPTWIPLSTNTLAGGNTYFSDPQSVNYPSRFYRVRSL